MYVLLGFRSRVRVKVKGIHRESSWCAPVTLLIQCRLHKTKKHTWSLLSCFFVVKYPSLSVFRFPSSDSLLPCWYVLRATTHSSNHPPSLPEPFGRDAHARMHSSFLMANWYAASDKGGPNLYVLAGLFKTLCPAFCHLRCHACI